MCTEDHPPRVPQITLVADLPKCYGIKAEDLPPFGKKHTEDFLLAKYSDILQPMTQNMPIFPFRHRQTAQK